ncbi:hypothetical protein NX059_001061 [Plenodomus lindquistii]|nr:hypothetical protein NX059_001061 [Plenodomus lindquistii]
MYGVLALATIAILARAWLQRSLKKRLEPQDYLIYAAFIFFFAMAMCDIVGIPRAYEVIDNGPGVSPRYTPGLIVKQYVRQMFGIMLLSWTSLLCVKLSLLALYKKLLAGQPRAYTHAWWAVCIFCVMGFIGSIISYTLSCKDFGRMMRDGLPCSGPRSVRGIGVTLYVGYALTISSDLLIMILPIRITWNLQVPRAQKIALFGLFSSGFLCITVATIRTAHIASGRYSETTKPIIVLIWTTAESAIAVCIGCCPVYFAAYRAAQTQRTSTDTHRFAAHPFFQRSRSQQLAGLGAGEAMKMGVRVGDKGRAKTRENVCLGDSAGTQYEPSGKDAEITVMDTGRR